MVAKPRKIYTEEKLLIFTSVVADFKNKPEKPQEQKTGSKLMETFKLHTAEIQEAIDKGYTIKEIVDALNEKGFEIELTTFKTYLNRVRKKIAEEQGGKNTTAKQKRGPKSKTIGNENKLPETKLTVTEQNQTDTVSPENKTEFTHEKPTEESVAAKVAATIPPATGTAKPTDLKARSKELFPDKK